MEKHIEDFWNVDAERELSDAWTGFTRFIFLNERPPDGYTGSGERLTRKQNTSRPDDIWPDKWTRMFDAAKKKTKQKWAIEKPKLHNARQLRGIFFIEPDVEEFKLMIKAAPRKLEVPMPAAMPCKIPTKSSGDTAILGNAGHDLLALLMPTKAQDQGSRSYAHLSSRSHHCERMNSMTHYSLVHKFIPMPQAMKIPNGKAAVVKNGKNWRKIRHGS